ncbi:uncharacterized protein LOC117320406 [Pecten maximus]|uniref:uncharacterized protein LOC117320406 n=1 Tax=Pecten maximus TaxID=6579 RepID=UPI0014580B8F|nr:uncharacterized protein LOC117320406 [Pecten maximus]
MAPHLQVTSIVLGFTLLHLAMVNTLDSMEVKDICSNSYMSIKEVGPGAVLEVGANKIPAQNPCVMRVDTCAHCKIEVEPYGKDFNLLGCDRNYDITGKACPVGYVLVYSHILL